MFNCYCLDLGYESGAFLWGALRAFAEKPRDDHGWINGGFFVCEPGVFDYIDKGEATVWEHGPLETLTREGQVNCYRHEGFWACMDTLADKQRLNAMWENGEAQWRAW